MPAMIVNEINKEFYKMQIQAIANNLMERSDDILADWDKGIRSIHIESDIKFGEVATLSVVKTYNPIKFNKEER